MPPSDHPTQRPPAPVDPTGDPDLPTLSEAGGAPRSGEADDATVSPPPARGEDSGATVSSPPAPPVPPPVDAKSERPVDLDDGGATVDAPSPAVAAAEAGPRTPSLPSKAHFAPLPEPELPPDLLARFEIVRTLGRGGMGVVYLGRDRRLDRQVALKLMLSSSIDMLSRFDAEGKVLAALEHDHVVRLYDYGWAGEVPYLVMEFVRGEPLSARLAAGRPTVIETVRIGCDILEGVLAAHRQGITHRDLKPANVFLEESGRAKVADFGVAARRRAGEGDIAEICGTPGYMAPEQARGQPTGPAADVYAIGVILHQMLTGQRLWSGQSLAQILDVQLNTCPVPPSRVNPSVPAVLSDLVERALAVDAKDRPSTDEMLSVMRGWLDRAKRSAREPGAAGFPSAPYKQLEHFGPDDAVIFYGRQAESMELVDAISSHGVRLLAIFGPCGIGKSSLVHAGLIPALTRARHEVLTLTSGPDPAQSVRESVAARATARGIKLPSGQPITARELTLAPDLLVWTMVELARAARRPQILVLDQMEEVFTQNPKGAPAISDIFELLVRLVESQVSGVKAILSYRSEFHASFFPLEERLSRHKRSYLVRQITEEGLQEAIEGPTEIEFYDFRYDSGLPKRIARNILDASHEGDTPLPVMQIICSQLYERLRKRGGTVIDAAAYAELGGVDGALARFVEDRLESPSYAGAGMARQMLKSLTVREEGRERFSRARDEVEVLAFPDQRAARATLERLISDHLVVRTPTREGGSSVRLASEVICKLVDGWELEPDATERAYRLLTKNHRMWEEGGRRDEDLIAGGALQFVESHLAELKDVTSDERAFVAASQKAHRRRVRERLFGLTVAFTLVLAMAYLSFLRPGTLKLATMPPGATVHLGGTKIGTTPLEYQSRPGVYEFRMSLPRHDDASDTVQISAGGNAVTTTVMQYQYGLLQVATAPLGASVTVKRAPPAAPDVTGVWTTPFTTEVLPGRYLLELKTPGYLPQVVGPVVVDDNRKLSQHNVQLRRNSGYLKVQCPFEGVDMDLLDGDGRLVWESTLPLKVPQELPVGQYTMRCTRAGSVAYTHSVDVMLGTTAEYTAWVPAVRVLWRFPTGATASSPALGHLDGDGVPDAVVGADDGQVRAVSGRTGLLLWSFAAGDVVASTASLGDLSGDGVPDVVIGCSDGRLLALDGAHGTLRWAFTAGGPVESSPALHDIDGDGVLDALVGSKDHNVYAVSGRSGKLIWRFMTGGEVRSSPALADLDGDGLPDVVIGSKDKFLYALSGKSGDQLWKVATGGWVASPALGDLDGDGIADAVAGSADNKLYAVSGRSGKVLWTFATGSLVSWAAGLADLNGDGVPDAVTGSTDRNVYAIDGRTGRELWHSATFGPVRAAVALDDMDADGVPDAVVGCSSGYVYVLSGVDGLPIWTYDTGGWVNSPALADVVGNGSPDVVVSSRGGYLSVLSTRPGGTAWVHEASADIRTRPLLLDRGAGTLPDAVVACDSGQVTAVSGTTGAVLWSQDGGAPAGGPMLACDVDGQGRPDVILPRQDGALSALAGDTGATLWTSPGPGPARAVTLLARSASAAPKDARIAVAQDGRVDVVDARTGVSTFSFVRPGVTSVVAAPAPNAAQPELLVVHGNTLSAVRTGQDKPLWELTASDRLTEPGVGRLTTTGPPEVVVGCADRHVRALDLTTGAVRWSTDLLAPVGSAPAFADENGDGSTDVVIASAYRALYMISGADGKLVWQTDVGGATADAPQLIDVNGTDYHDPVVGSSDRRVRVLAGATGRELLNIDVGEPLSSGPVLGPSPSKSDPYVRVYAVHEKRMLMLSRMRWPYRHVVPRGLTLGRSMLPPPAHEK